MIFSSSRKGLPRIVYNAVAYESSFPTSSNYNHFFEFLRWSRKRASTVCSIADFHQFPRKALLLFSKFNPLKTDKQLILTWTLFIVLK